MYAERDLERLEQIIALKFLGVPLKQIKNVLDRPEPALLDTLRLQRRALEEKQQRVSRAICAIRAAEDAIETSGSVNVAILKRVIEVIDMQGDVEAMKKYYSSEESWEKHRRLYEEGPSQAWCDLYRDVSAALDEDPAGDRAQSLADRWLHLSAKAYSGDPDHQTHSATAWMDRDHWPPSMKRRMAELNLEQATRFMERAAVVSRQKYFSEEAWSKFIQIRKDPARISAIWQSRVDLFREIECGLSENASSIRTLWMAHVEAASSGDAGVKTGLLKLWADRKNWTATIRWLEETLSMMTGKRFDRVADIIDSMGVV
jgi:DNA-binding transcriptional MerR regulator